jgi:signal transduction histidine kinase/ActR/RegA family two-component response regulator
MALLFGLDASAALGRPISDALTIDDTEGGESPITILTARGPNGSPAPRQVLVRRRDRPPTAIRCLLTTVPLGPREEAEWCLLFHPMTDEAEDAAFSAVADTFLEVSEVAAVVFGADRRVLLVNSAAEELFEAPRSRLLGRLMEDIERRLGKEEGAAEDSADGEARILGFSTGEGRQRFLRRVLRGVTLSGTAPAFYVLTLDDITDELRTEEELRKMHRMQSLRSLVGGIAHDFNDLITAVLGNISLARLENASAAEIRNLLFEAEQALGQAENLTHELSALSESSGQQPRTGFSELVQSAAAFVLRGTNVKLRATFGAGLPDPALDANRLAQVVQNLVMNAQQAMPEGGIVEVSADRDEISFLTGKHLPSVRLTVRDHGEGIPRVHLKRIFEPFYTTRRTGSGLGLTVAQSIVVGSGGRIEVESKPGYGSAFTVLLPSTEAHRQKAGRLDNSAAYANKKILVMDDDRFIRDILGRMVDRLGCRSSLAADGNEAVFLYQEAMDSGHPFDAVIMDLTVPGGMGGKDAVRRILRVDPEATVVVTSGLPNDPVLKEYKRFGFRGSVAKPFTFEEIADTLATVLTH